MIHSAAIGQQPGDSRLRHAVASEVHVPNALSAYTGRGHDQRVTALVAHNLALARRCEQLHLTASRLERLAYIDGLTGLAKRRFFDRALDSEIRRASRTKLPLALILCDIDHFKHCNDVFGHQHGDKVLALIGVTLRSSLRRAGDVAARLGGEEFALLLASVGPMDALALAEQLRRSVEDLRLGSATNSATRLSISLGVTTYHSAIGCRPIELVEAADIALYRAKAAGRNCARYHALKSPD
ncbi:MAG TPA: GGDEF domain-containing protein [Gammaproteobacteria bacterium]|nr:GGDEF domain-containing protein [Gammaproteobacteria bacterium]